MMKLSYLTSHSFAYANPIRVRRWGAQCQTVGLTLKSTAKQLHMSSLQSHKAWNTRHGMSCRNYEILFVDTNSAMHQYHLICFWFQTRSPQCFVQSLLAKAIAWNLNIDPKFPGKRICRKWHSTLNTDFLVYNFSVDNTWQSWHVAEIVGRILGAPHKVCKQHDNNSAQQSCTV